MTFRIQNALVGSQGIEQTSTTQRHPLGTIIPAEDELRGGGEFIYLSGAASLVAGDWATYNLDDGSITLLAANAIGPVCIAMAAPVAAEFGWFAIQGKIEGNAATSFADDGNVYATATAGRIDDAIVAGDRVKRAKGASAEASNLADFEIDRPFMDDALAA